MGKRDFVDRGDCVDPVGETQTHYTQTVPGTQVNSRCELSVSGRAAMMRR